MWLLVADSLLCPCVFAKILKPRITGDCITCCLRGYHFLIQKIEVSDELRNIFHHRTIYAHAKAW